MVISEKLTHIRHSKGGWTKPSQDPSKLSKLWRILENQSNMGMCSHGCMCRQWPPVCSGHLKVSFLSKETLRRECFPPLPSHFLDVPGSLWCKADVPFLRLNIWLVPGNAIVGIWQVHWSALCPALVLAVGSCPPHHPRIVHPLLTELLCDLSLTGVHYFLAHLIQMMCWYQPEWVTSSKCLW